MNFHRSMMELALEEARLAAVKDEVPVGAVIARGGEVVAKSHNLCRTTGDPTAHAEILAIRQAASKLGGRLSDCTLYVTLEPCPMCAGAMMMARLGSCFFAAADKRQGCCESLYALPADPAFYHRLPCVGGLMEEEAAEILTTFFKDKRHGDAF
ncbi:MAG: nucleoside deaminase [Clostridiales bacterium]|nr:nucleoside deaminase [Clostridiales bacterium]